MSQLKSGSSLQGGKYRIEKVLGQGGFGITYLATQELLDRKVCIKEFFFKEYCERDEATSHVSLGTQSNHEMVERFMSKFLKEARTISQLDHPNIIRIHDIFKENNTAYYIMEYIEGESLSDKVSIHGPLPESEATDYIRQVASALGFIHQRSINHLDVKPANIMIRNSDNKAILIDFGLSKQYDEQGGQTSTTPVGISHGYAPMEQYKQGGVSFFSPQTDIYALGATLYKLVTGNTPPQAMDILDEGLPSLPASVSASVADTIKKAMQPRKVDRPDKIEDFVKGLTVSSERVSNTSDATGPLQSKERDEETRFIEEIYTKTENSRTEDINMPKREPVMIPEKKNGKKSNWLAWLIVIAILGGGAYFIYDRISLAQERALAAEALQTRKRLHQQYISLIKEGDDFFASGNYLSAANCYGHAYNIEKEYQTTPYYKEFNEGANDKKNRALQAEQDAKKEQERLKQEQQKRAAEIAEQRRKEESEANQVRWDDKSQSILYKNHRYRMVYVEGGAFYMGNTPEQGEDVFDNATPAHSVTVNSYSIGQTEVPQWLWEKVMGSNPSRFKGDNLPAQPVSWIDCQNFINRLNNLTGKNFRLPTEAEWEYAARGGKYSRGYKYSGSNGISEVAWYEGNTGTNDMSTWSVDNPSCDINPVGQKRSNELGLYDMSGNVCEWCYDWHATYTSSTKYNPTGPAQGTKRVLRGGDGGMNKDLCRVSHRISREPHDNIGTFGLRIAITQ